MQILILRCQAFLCFACPHAESDPKSPMKCEIPTALHFHRLTAIHKKDWQARFFFPFIRV